MPTTFKLPRGGFLQLFTRELRVKITGNEKNALEAVAFFIEGEIKERIVDSPRGGRTYRRGKTLTSQGFPTVHRASAAGEAPAPDRGFLLSSIRAGGPKKVAVGFESIVGSNLQYARFLEEGTSRMDARPLWRVTLRESKNEIFRLFQAFLSK